MLDSREIVQARVHRIIKRLGGFRDPRFLENALFPDLPENFIILALYENNFSFPEDNIVIGYVEMLLRRNGAWVGIPYLEISEVNLPGSDKRAYWRLHLVTKAGPIIELPLLGGPERKVDCYEFLRFLNRVREDLSRRK